MGHQQTQRTPKAIHHRPLAAPSTRPQLNSYLQIYNETLAADPDLHSTTFTIFVAVGGRTPAEVAELVESLNTTFSRFGIKFRPPKVGKQEELWAAMQPGAARSSVMDLLADETTIDEFAELIPFTTAAIGHRRGPIIARNLTSGLGELVRLAAEEVVQSNRSPAIAFVSSPGRGKSSGGKGLAYLAHGRGQSWGAIDRSNIEVKPGQHTGEWVKFAAPIPNTQVVDVANPPGSMDPLKVWWNDPQLASLRAYGLCVELLNLKDENQELALVEALQSDMLHDRGITSMMALARYLTAQNDHAAVLVGRKIKSWSYRTFAAAVFDESLPALTLTAQGTVFRTHGFALPGANKVLHEHLYTKLQPEERYALAIYPLVTAFLADVFERRQQTAWLFIDEAWTVTRTPVGHELVEPKLRDSRKHDLIPVFMTQTAAIDLADDIYNLITIKFLGGAEDRDLAVSNLEWFKAMPITDDSIAEVMAAKNGRFFMSMVNDDDSNGDEEHGIQQVAEVQMLLPADPVVREAMSSTPMSRRARAAWRREQILVPA
jgi:hypothetical protein